jgi:ABC-type enterochelin transport system ATPase subunit
MSPSLPARGLLGLNQLYKWTLSPLIGRDCRYLPTCSSYAADAIRTHGAWVARLFVKPAPLVLLDEPFAALDPAGFRLVEALIDEQKQRGATVVMATHLLERARELGDAAVVLAGGRVTWSGSARDLPPAEVAP